MALRNCEWRTCSRSQHSDYLSGESNSYSVCYRPSALTSWLCVIVYVMLLFCVCMARTYIHTMVLVHTPAMAVPLALDSAKFQLFVWFSGFNPVIWFPWFPVSDLYVCLCIVGIVVHSRYLMTSSQCYGSCIFRLPLYRIVLYCWILHKTDF